MTDAAPFVAKVIGQGKVTIPYYARALHDIADGDYVELVLVRKLNGRVQAKEEEATDAVPPPS